MNPELALRLPRPDPGKWMSGALAVLVHVILGSLLFFGVRWQTQPPQVVEVELYQASPSRPAPPAARPEPPKPVPRVAPPPEPPRPAPIKPDIAVKAPEKIKTPPKVEPKPEPKPQPKPVQKAPAQPPQPAAPDWSKELQQEQSKLSNLRAAQAADKELRELKASQASAQAAAARGKALKGWADRIAAKVRGNLAVPPGVTGNPEAEFEISLLPDAGVLDVRLKKSSGNRTLDAAIERAIRKSSPLPQPENPAVFQRELRFIFRPLDNQ